MQGLLVWLIGFAVFVYLLLPGVLRFNQKYKPNTDLETVTLSTLPPDAAQYRPTWKGAYLMTWSQLWPMKAINKARAKREAHAELQSLGTARVGIYQV